MPKPLVISYLRFSRPEQALGDSIRRQLAMSDAWVKARGLSIDTSLKDHGVSAFRGANATVGALGHFLSIVQAGEVPRGSILLVESLDRLSRNQIRLALAQFLSIIDAGVTIVTLSDGREYSDTHCELPDLIMSIMIMSRAHEESATKSRRLSEAWNAKRARITEEPLTTLLPAWCTMADGAITAIPEKVRTIRALYRWALDGFGLTAITKKANLELKPIGRVPYFTRSYVHKVLKNRATLGEFQPHKIEYVQGRRRRIPIGEPLLQYFPAIIDASTFAAVQAQLRSGRRGGGPAGPFVSIFRGLLWGDDGSRFQVMNKGVAYGGRVMMPASTLDGRHGKRRQVSFPLRAFETAFFGRLSEMMALKLDNRATDHINQRLISLEEDIATTKAKIETLTGALIEQQAVSPSMVAVMSQLDQQLAALETEREAIRTKVCALEQSGSADAATEIAQLLVDSILAQQSPEIRQRLWVLVRQILTRGTLRLSRSGPITTCDVAVELVTGQSYSYSVEIHRRCPHTLKVHWVGGCETMSVSDTEPASAWYAPADIVGFRQAGKTIADIKAITGLSVSAIYRAFAAAGASAEAIRPVKTGIAIR